MTGKNRKNFCGPAQDGFTLLELVVAMFVLSLGITAVLIIFPLSIQITSSSEKTALASQIAQEKIEEVISTPYAELVPGVVNEPQLASPFSVFSRETKITYVDPTLNFQETTGDLGIKKAEVTVSWTTSLIGSVQSVKVETLVSKR